MKSIKSISLNRSASAVASVLLSTMEEMKVEQEKREKLVIGRHLEKNKEEQKAKEHLEKSKEEEQKAKEQQAKEEITPSVKEKSSKEEKVEKGKAGKRLITPEKAKADKKQKAGNPPREALAPVTNRFPYHSLFSAAHQFSHSPRKAVAPSALLAKTIVPPPAGNNPSTDPPPSIRCPKQPFENFSFLFVTFIISY